MHSPPAGHVLRGHSSISIPTLPSISAWGDYRSLLLRLPVWMDLRYASLSWQELYLWSYLPNPTSLNWKYKYLTKKGKYSGIPASLYVIHKCQPSKPQLFPSTFSAWFNFSFLVNIYYSSLPYTVIYHVLHAWYRNSEFLSSATTAELRHEVIINLLLSVAKCLMET